MATIQEILVKIQNGSAIASDYEELAKLSNEQAEIQKKAEATAKSLIDTIKKAKIEIIVRKKDGGVEIQIFEWDLDDESLNKASTLSPSFAFTCGMRIFITSSFILASIKSSSSSNWSCCVLTTIVSMPKGTFSSLYFIVT